MKADRLLPLILLVAATCCFTQVIVESHVLNNCVASDVVFLVDSSSDVSGSDFRRQLTFLRDVVDRLPIGPDAVRVSVVTYGGLHPSTRVRFPLHSHPSKEQLRDAVESIPQQNDGPRRRGKTPTAAAAAAAAAAEAIGLARRTFLLGGGGDIPRRSRVMVVVGGGGRLADAAAARVEASAAKSDGVTVMAVEVGRGADGDEEGLRELVSSPAERNTMGVADFADLAKIRDLTARKICEVKAPTPISSGIAGVSSDILRSKESDVSARTHQLPDSDSKSYLPPTHGNLFYGRIFRHASASVTHPQASTKPSKQDAIPTVSRPTEPISFRTDAVLGASTEAKAAKRYKNGEEGEHVITVGFSVLKSTTVESQSTDLAASKSTESHAGSRDTGTTASLANTDSYIQSPVDLSSIEDESLLETNSEKPAVSKSNSSSLGTMETVSLSSNDLTVSEVNSVEALRRISDIRNVVGIEHVSEIPTDGHESNKDLKSHGTQRHHETAERHVAEYDIRDDYVTSTDEIPRIRHQVSPSYRGYWRLDEKGRLVRYREIRPGLFDKEGGPEFQGPRSENGDLRFPTAPAQQQGRRRRLRKPSTMRNFDPWTSTGTGPGTKERIYYVPLNGLSRGDRSGSSQEAQTARNHSRSCDDPHHKAAPQATGFYRFNDGEELVWQNFTASQLLSQNRSLSSNCSRGDTSADPNQAATDMTGPRPSFRPRKTTQSPGRKARSRARTTPADETGSSARRNPLRVVVDRSVRPGPNGQKAQTVPDDVDKDKKLDSEDWRLDRGPEGAGQGHWRYDLSGRRVWITHSPHHQKTPPGIHRTATPTTPVTPSNTSADPFLERPNYGFWNNENGERIWYEYDPSSGRHRPVNDSTDGGGGGGQGSNKVRLELPPSLASVARSRINVTCRGCNVIVPLPGGDKSSAIDDLVVAVKDNFRFNSSSAVESPPPPDSVVSGLHRPRTPGQSRQHLSDPIPDKGGVGEQKQKVKNDSQVLKLLTTARPKRRKSHNRTTSSPGYDHHHPGHSLKASPPSSWDHEKPVKVCTARHPLSAAFVVDPRSLKRSQAKMLWNLAYEVVRRLRMDDGRVRIRFFPELQRRIAADSSTGTGSSSAHGDHTMIHTTTVHRKPVPDLLRSVADVLLDDNTTRGGGAGGGGGGGGEPPSARKPDRRVIVYLTDGPSGSGVDGLRRAAEEFRSSRKGIEVLAVGLGEDTTLPELDSIADFSSGRKRGRRRVSRLLDPMTSDVETLTRELTFALCGLKPYKGSRSVGA